MHRKRVHLVLLDRGHRDLSVRDQRHWRAIGGQNGFAIHAADGTPMALIGDREVAMAAIQQHEMHARSVH